MLGVILYLFFDFGFIRLRVAVAAMLLVGCVIGWAFDVLIWLSLAVVVVVLLRLLCCLLLSMLSSLPLAQTMIHSMIWH